MKHYLNVPFSEKDDAKSAGAIWDPQEKRWYYEKEEDEYKFKKWIVRDHSTKINLSSEQQKLIRLAKQGKNVLVDACIGSGKTTTIQALCNELPDKRILYLTYNTLLKLDAKEKIRNRNVTPTNYHGFAYMCLQRAGIRAGQSDLIQTFLKNKDAVHIPRYDLLVLDEYQDIEQEIAEMLKAIKDANPELQIVAVGDMAQKIYDKTSLDVERFVKGFLGKHEEISFTKCFRLQKGLAKRLGKIWGKPIRGVNEFCKVTEMDLDNAVDFLSKQPLGDILCLGQREGTMAQVLNLLEERYPEKFNKRTVYASIRDEDRDSVRPDRNTAIFTTFDSSKGLERKVCMVFDFTQNYWESRLDKPNTKYEIMRNIFCVAASRGKESIVFVKNNAPLIEDRVLATPAKEDLDYSKPFEMSDMFSFKYKEDIEECFSLLKIRRAKTNTAEVIDIKSNDELIDLSACIGILQEAAFFEGYDIDGEIDYALDARRMLPIGRPALDAPLEEKILYLASVETGYKRYATQVGSRFVTSEELEKIKNRLALKFKPSESVQCDCEMVLLSKKADTLSMRGRADVVKRGVVYELKFVSELSHEHFLQCACYVVAMGLEKGVLWNTKTNERYSIQVPDKEAFLNTVAKTVTKRHIKKAKLVSNRAIHPLPSQKEKSR